jgi:hypothetical protein
MPAKMDGMINVVTDGNDFGACRNTMIPCASATSA